MGPRPSQSPDSSLRSRLAGFLSSLCVLAGVFFFINSACGRSTSDDDDDYEDSYNCGVSIAAAPGASIAIVTPKQGAVGAEGDDLVEVQIELGYVGVAVDPDPCRDGAGHFEVSITRLNAEDCGAESAPLVFNLRESSVTTQQLPAGNYTIRARFLNANNDPFRPALVAETQITVVSAHLEAGVPSCP